MKINSKQKNEFSVIIDIMIFLTVVSLVGLTRLFYIYFKEKSNLDLSYVENASYLNENKADNINSSMATAINNVYNVDIVYGERSEAYAKSVKATTLKDNQKIFNMIKIVNNALKKYPKDIISEIEKKGYTVTIYLVDEFQTDNLALANRTATGEFRIYLSYQGGLERALHHETYHILDYYAKLEQDENKLYASWQDNNPTDFEYTNDVNKITAKYVYIDGQKGAYFITPYAKYSVKEDRAETFAQMMIDDTKKTYYNKDEMIYNKMIIIKDTLYKVFDCVSTDIKIKYFERYL